MSALESTGPDPRSPFVGQPIDDATALVWAGVIFDLMAELRLPGKESAALGWLLRRTICRGHTGTEYWAREMAEATRSGESNIGTTVKALAGKGLVEYSPGQKYPHQSHDEAIPSRVVILDPGLISPLKRGEPPKTPGGAQVRDAVNALRAERLSFAHAQNVESVRADLAALRAARHPAARSAEAMAWLLGSWADDAHLARTHRVKDWPGLLTQWGVPLPSDGDLQGADGTAWGRSRCVRAGRLALRRAGLGGGFPAADAS